MPVAEIAILDMADGIGWNAMARTDLRRIAAGSCVNYMSGTGLVQPARRMLALMTVI